MNDTFLFKVFFTRPKFYLQHYTVFNSHLVRYLHCKPNHVFKLLFFFYPLR